MLRIVLVTELGKGESDGGRDHPCAYHRTPRHQSTALCRAKRPSLPQSQQKRVEGPGLRAEVGRRLVSGWESWSTEFGFCSGDHHTCTLLFMIHVAFVPPQVAGMVPFPRIKLFKLYLRRISIGVVTNHFLLYSPYSQSFPSFHLLRSGELTQ